MWQKNWREQLWARIDRPWDLLIIGGGITGAGILREAARAGLKCLLVERADFASGTSSASSKLVHGGLRYLAAGDWRLTLESVRERQALMTAAPGLIEPQEFILPMYRGSKPGRLLMGAALGVYDLMARKRYSRYQGLAETRAHMPQLRAQDLRGSFAYVDARTDDTRLVLRVLSEAIADGGLAANYLNVEDLIREDGRVVGVHARDGINGQQAEIRAKAVVNATGPWVDSLRKQVDAQPRLRPLRGSHFVFEFARLPLAQAVTLFHPQDQRPLFAFPWEGATLFGTTDLDHPDWPQQPPCMTGAEATYLEAALTHYFPSFELNRHQALSAYSGVRPIVAGGADKPSAESRESAIWQEGGLLSVTGGKLTTYRVTALEVLEQLRGQLPAFKRLDKRAPVLQSVTIAGNRRLTGRFGANYSRINNLFDVGPQVPGSVTHWAELKWAARFEAVEHLADLMLRRTRLGLLLPDGGAKVLNEIGVICRQECGWDQARWAQESADYLAHWRTRHDPAIV